MIIIRPFVFCAFKNVIPRWGSISLIRLPKTPITLKILRLLLSHNGENWDEVQADLGDIEGLVPDYHNKADIIIKRVT